MLNNPDIISRLSEEQKLALVTDIGALSDEAINACGVPHVERTTLEALNGEVGGDAAYPSLYGLANSWNTKLAEQVAGDLVRRNGSDKYNIIGTAAAYVKASPYAVGMSEDPYLCAKLVGASVGAIEQFGGAACLEGCGVRGIDLECLDAQPTAGAINNYLTRAYGAVIRNRVPSSAHVSYAKVKGGRDINAKLAADIAGKSEVKYMLCSEAPEEALRSGLSSDKQIFLGAPTAPIRAALKNHRRMKDDVEHGSVSLDEFEKAMTVGTAISEEMLDAAVDKVIDFAAAVKRPRMRYSDEQPSGESSGADDRHTSITDYSRQIALAAAEESIVLLKNDNDVLPLSSGLTVATFGELAESYSDFDRNIDGLCAAFGAKHVGHALGYKTDSDRCDELLPDAINLAASADVLLVFTGLGEARTSRMTELKNAELPASQEALVSELCKTGKRVVAAVVGDILPAAKFDKNVHAALYAPQGGSRTLEAIVRILFGATCPSGRLASTAYNDPDALFAKQKSDVALGRYRIGEFVGYRRYVSENSKVKYPFGFGLSYTKFEYSNIKVDGEGVEVTVRNVGNRAGAEVAQMYIGKRDSAVLRPSRELKGFAKFVLAPGAAMQIKFPINAAMLEVLDPSDGKRKTENGAYEVYIGASSTDIRLTASVNMQGVSIPPCGEKLSDYLPSLSNLENGGYTMKTVAKTAQKEVAFKSARPADAFGYERLFAEEFGETDELGAEDEDDTDDYSAYIDDTLTVEDTVEDFVKYAAERGTVIDPSDARDIFGAMFASRVTIFKCGKSEFDSVVNCLCGYFGCPVSMDNAHGYAAPDSLFGHGAGSGLMNAIEFACAHRDVVTFAALDNVALNKLGEVFAPFIMYATSPDNFKVNTAQGRTIDVSQNVWFLMRDGGETTDERGEKFPAYLAEMATVLAPDISACPVKPARAHDAPDYFRLNMAFQKAERNYEIDEPLWKGVDRLEGYVAARTPFAIGNKMYVQMEKMIAVAMACGGESAAALDGALSAKLMPRIVCATEGKLAADDGDIAQTVSDIFGDEDTVKCLRIVKRF